MVVRNEQKVQIARDFRRAGVAEVYRERKRRRFYDIPHIVDEPQLYLSSAGFPVLDPFRRL